MINKNLLKQASEITMTNYRDIAKEELADAVIEDLLNEIKYLKEEIKKLECDIENNYVKIQNYEYGE